MDNEKLVAKFGSWVRVQVAFYDFIFESALKTCASCFNESVVSDFSDDGDLYEKSVATIEAHFSSFEEAWKMFNKQMQADAYCSGVFPHTGDPVNCHICKKQKSGTIEL